MSVGGRDGAEATYGSEPDHDLILMSTVGGGGGEQLVGDVCTIELPVWVYDHFDGIEEILESGVGVKEGTALG